MYRSYLLIFIIWIFDLKPLKSCDEDCHKQTSQVFKTNFFLEQKEDEAVISHSKNKKDQNVKSLKTVEFEEFFDDSLSSSDSESSFSTDEEIREIRLLLQDFFL